MASLAEKYAYRVTWSQEDEAFVGTCAEFPSLSHLDRDSNEAWAGIRELVASVVEDMLANKEAPPEPIALREYSGVLSVRLPPELHRKLSLEAAESQISLNRLISNKLAG